MIDLGVVSVKGLTGIRKGRAILKDTNLRFYDYTGAVVSSLWIDSVMRVQSLLRIWQVEFSHGTLQLSARCSCGKWRKQAKKTAEELWSGV